VLLYAMGANLGSKARTYGFTAKEQARIKRGFADSIAGRKLNLKGDDMEEWGERVDAMLARRTTPKVTEEKKRGAAFASSAAKEEGASTLPSGVVIKMLAEGTGPSPKAADIVRVRYEGRLNDGTVFDSTDKHGGAPAELRLDKVIPCWTQAIPHMKAGGKARIVCPSSTAYGDQGRPPQIPGGATLSFDVELLEIRP
jgi:FKBP-type peptidyl-prolyl cis-trans isomerase FkpA